MVFSYIYSIKKKLNPGSVREEEESSNDLSSSCIIGKSLTPNVMAPMPKNTVLTNVKN